MDIVHMAVGEDTSRPVAVPGHDREAQVKIVAKALRSKQAAIRIHDKVWAEQLARNVVNALSDKGYLSGGG